MATLLVFVRWQNYNVNHLVTIKTK